MEPNSPADSDDSAGARNILAKLQKSCEEGNFYNAQQMYKSMYFRYLGQKKYAKTLMLLMSGIKTMLHHNQVLLATELAGLMIQLYHKSDEPLNENSLSRIEQIVSLYPTIQEDPSAVQQKIQFLQEAIAWSEKVIQKMGASAPFQVKGQDWGHPRLHLLLARTFSRNGDFALAQKHYLRCGDFGEPEEQANSLFSWAKTGQYSSEWDFFVARAVLQMLCVPNNVTMAQRVFTAYMDLIRNYEKHPSNKFETPLTNCIRFMLLAVERHNYTLFQTLCKDYQPSLSSDSSFEKYLDKIPAVVFGVKSEKSSDMFGAMLSSLFGTNSASSSSSSFSLGAPSSSLPQPPSQPTDIDLD